MQIYVLSCRKTIMMITERTHCFHDFVYAYYVPLTSARFEYFAYHGCKEFPDVLNNVISQKRIDLSITLGSLADLRISQLYSSRVISQQ